MSTDSNQLNGVPTPVRVSVLFGEILQLGYRRTDHLLAVMLVAQWAIVLGCATWISPIVWHDLRNEMPPLWIPVGLCGAMVALAVVLIGFYSGQALTRHIAAATQMLISALFVHVSGGHFSTHYHLFGSLVLVACYRDWTVILTALVVVVADGLLRGRFWPESIHGPLFRMDCGRLWLEQMIWVLFAVGFLVFSCALSVNKAQVIAAREAAIEERNALVEAEVQRRIAELHKSRERLREAVALSQANVEEARRAEADLKALIENTSDAIWAVDRDLRLITFNAAFAESFTLIHNRPPTLGENLIGVVPEESEWARWNDWYTQALRGNRQVVEYDLSTKRLKRNYEIAFNPTVSREEIVGVSVFARDVTLTTQAKREIYRARDAAEAASKAKSQFLTNMSHEIRTPMNGVIGMTELLFETDLTAEQKDYLGFVRSSAEALLVIINDILDLAKIESGKLTLEPVAFDLRNHIRDSLGPLTARAEKKGLSLLVTVDSDVPDQVVTDPVRLRQVLLNLASNAVKFTSQGQVAIRVRREPPSDAFLRLHFEVQDSGIGIPADKLGSVFRPFEQADSSTTRRYGGTGLGLSIATQLVELMGGRIWADSTPGQGSTFHFTARVDLADQLEPLAL